jgi:hypothetical protein
MDRLIGVSLVTLSAILFGTKTIFARMSYDAGANPATFLFLRFLIASPLKVIGACLVISAVVILAKSEYETAQVKISHLISP